MAKKIVIIGAGGHGKVVCDAILLKKDFEIIGFVDGNVPVGTEVISGYKVIASQKDLRSLKNNVDYFIVAIGNNEIRQRLYEEIKTYMKPATILHPTAVIGSGTSIGSGSVVLAYAVINAGSSIGENTIINSRTVVDHDCTIGDHSHLSIGTMVGSNSTVGTHFLSAIGENINSFSKIGIK